MFSGNAVGSIGTEPGEGHRLSLVIDIFMLPDQFIAGIKLFIDNYLLSCQG